MKSHRAALLKSVCLLGLAGIAVFTGCQTASKPSSKKLVAIEAFSPLDLPNEEALVANSGILPNQVGYILYDPLTHKTVSHLNPKLPFIPSSVTKVISTTAALRILGPDYQFKTDLYQVGTVQNQVLGGDLFLKGTGDPLLTVADIMSLVQALKASGLKKITGHFFYDETFLSSHEAIDEVRDGFAAYNSGLSALSSEFNRSLIRWKPATTASVMQAYSVPVLPWIEIGLAEQDPPVDAQLLYQKIEGKDRWLLSPLTFKSGKQNVPVKKPALFTCHLFKHLAHLNGIELPDPEAREVPRKAKLIYSLKSLPLIDLTQKVLEFSNNAMAELIHLVAARKLSGKALSLSDSSKVITGWLKTNIPGASWGSFQIQNGSGLGAANRITPQQLLSVLEYADHHLTQGRGYLSLLPISGWTGSLSERMTVPDTAFRVWAKTGTQSFSSALAGYLFTRTGRKLIFAFLATDFESRKILEPFTGPVPDEIVKKASRWQGQVRLLEDQLLTRWIYDH